MWTEPMWTVAPRYGLSDVGMAKVCRRYRIPVPGRGYWQQKQAGQRVHQIQLPKLSATQAETLGIISFNIRERLPTNDDDVMQPPLVVVPEVLTDPHPLVEHTIRALRRVRPTKEGLLPQTGARITWMCASPSARWTAR